MGDIDLKAKVKNDRYIKENLNIYEEYVVNSISDWDSPKLRNCLDYKEVRVNSCVNTKGTTFLHYAASKQDSHSSSVKTGSILNALLNKGADPFLKDSDGLTAYDYAVSKNYSNNAIVLKSYMDKKK